MATDEEQLNLQLRQDYDAPGLLEVQSTVIKAGPQAWKTAALLTFGDKATGEVKRRTLRVQTWRREGSGYGFENKSNYRWSCDDEEVTQLLALLSTHLPSPGSYTLLDEASASAVLARLVAGDASDAADAVVELLELPAVRDALAASGAAVAGAALVNAQRQRTVLERLRTAIMDPDMTEHGLNKALSGEWWLFGGRFVGEHERRKFTSLDQLDIPLLRADGSLHIVELKRANIPKLVLRHRNHLVPGEDVHLAVGQAMNYLRALDEQAAQIRQDLGVNVRRSSATVVVGHPDYCKFTDQQVAETLRTFNSHLARIEVISYAELLTGATAALSASELDDVSEAHESLLAPGPIATLTVEQGDVDAWAESSDPWTSAAASWGDEPPF